MTPRRSRRWIPWLGLGLAIVLVVNLAASRPTQAQLANAAPLLAQTRVRPQVTSTIDRTWQAVYDLVPDIPLENHYISRSTGEVATENTLIGRIVFYHTNVRRRSPLFRLDWLLTLADYLGVNTWIDPSTYPSATTLNENPLDGDRAAIASLTRAQRHTLVEALVLTFNPAYLSNLQATPIHTLTAPAHTPPPTTPPPPSPLPPLPQPGDAQLLAP
jgi:hypothetical protein